MSNLERLAALIPDEYRKEMLELNMIDSAKATETDESMHYLVVIWTNYVDSTFDPSCNLCRGTLLNNLRAMLPALIELEKQKNLLKAL